MTTSDFLLESAVDCYLEGIAGMRDEILITHPGKPIERFFASLRFSKTTDSIFILI